MNRTIVVKGRATVSSPSEITCVRAVISGRKKTFDSAMGALAETTTKLKDVIEAAGIDRKELKTSDLSIEQSFREEKIGEDKYGHDKFKNVPNGFRYRQNVFFEFENDNEKLSEIISNISGTDLTPAITFSYRCKDPEELKNRALSKAAENARREAQIIVESCGAKLGKLVEVKRNVREYDDYRNESVIGCSLNAICDERHMIDIDPEDHCYSDEVTMIWEIAD